MDQIKALINEVIQDCQNILVDKSYQTPNIPIINVILREFIEMKDYLAVNNKILLLDKDKLWTLWSIRTIIDSADYGFDKDLFDKVRMVSRLSEKLDEKYVVYKY